MTGTEFVHYGSSHFEREKFRPIENIGFTKPGGGLWASPVNSEFGWKKWCEEQEFHLEDLDRSFRFTLSPKAKVYIIDSLEDLVKLPKQRDPRFRFFVCLDFERVARKYDALYLTCKGQKETRHSQPINLYGWDCESILILKPYNIII